MSSTEIASPARHATRFALVVALHLGLGYALLTGLGHQVVEVLRQPLTTRIISEQKPPPPPPPPPPAPTFAAPPPPYIPPPEIQVARPPAPTAITAVSTVKPIEPPPPAAPVATPVAPAPVVRVPPVIDAAHSCQQPEYPATSRRLEEAGAVVLQFLIDTDGRVIDSKIDSSSGFPRLDKAALSALSLCRFKPGTVDGKPEQSWAKLRYVWRLD